MNAYRRTPPAPAGASLAIAAAVLIAACGGSNKPPSPSVAGHDSGDPGIQAAYRYASCMRGHGVSSFQDPHVHTTANSTAIAFHVDPAITGSPNFKSAQKACSHILPGPSGGPTPAQRQARERAILAFADCMRQHGFPTFPDPTGQGQLTPAMLSKAGIDLRQPAIKPAAYTCVAKTHGIITRADVNQAIAHSTGSATQASSGG